jgi:hypothetical protein
MEVPGTRTYPMTYEQEAIWLADHLDDQPSRYLESWVYRLTGRLDETALRWALLQVAERHEALRTVLASDGGHLVQVVLPVSDILIEHRPGQPLHLEQQLQEVVSHPLDLDRSPLRVTLLQLAPEDCILIVQFHHAVIDDWALTVLDTEVSELYQARRQGRSAKLGPPPARQMGEYARDQRAAGLDPAALAYWRERLRDLPPRSSLAPDYSPGARLTSRGSHIWFRIEPMIKDLIIARCRAQRTTPFTVLAAALATVLCRANGTADVILGTPVARRPADFEQLIGCLTDLMPLRLAVRQQAALAELVTSVRAVLRECLAQPAIPYSELVTRAVSRKELRYRPLCPTVLVVDDAASTPLNLPGLIAERLYVPSGTAKFDLCLTLVRRSDGYLGLLEYSRDLYAPATGEQLVADFQMVLSSALRHPDEPLLQLMDGQLETSGSHISGGRTQ